MKRSTKLTPSGDRTVNRTRISAGAFRSASMFAIGVLERREPNRDAFRMRSGCVRQARD
jgi:hypothetical protein